MDEKVRPLRRISLEEEQRNEQGIADLTRAIKRDPNDERAYSSRAYYYGRLGQYGKAIADTTKLIELDPKRATL